ISVGEFDGDGVMDVFQATGAGWFYSSGGLTEWRFLNNQSDRLPDMRLADFDGNGTSDLFAVHGTTWVVSYDGTDPWQSLATDQPYDISELGVGEFDGDGLADIFRADGERWWIWGSQARAWSAVNVSGKELSDVRLVDLSCDGITDVLSLVQGQWQVSYGAATTWTVLGESFNDNLSGLVFADFDGSGCSDIAWTFTTYPPPPGSDVPRPPPVHTWRWLPDGQGSWQVLNESPGVPLLQARVADFDGDRRADVLRYGEPPSSPLFELSSRGGVPWVTHSWHPMK
ncbi:MAG: hypothetical protein ACRD2X_20680, partial [Vicinamibacteraceae bacterium]